MLSRSILAASLAALLPVACIVVNEPSPKAGMISVRSFLQRCNEAKGWNFTYAQDLEGELERAHVAPFDPAAIPDACFPDQLERTLAESGFEVRPVGPVELHTLLIRRAG